MLEYDGPLVRKNRELSEFVHEVVAKWEAPIRELIGTTITKELAECITERVKEALAKALLAREVPYSHPIYGALEPKGSVANVCKR